MEGKASDWRPGPTVCRCCLTEGCYKDISTEYFWMGKREVYAEMLADTLNVSIAYSKSGGPNSNSRLICEPCISRLRDASDFKRQVLDCEKTFMHHLDPGSTSKTKELESIGDVKVELVKREKETNSDDDFDDRPDFLDIDTEDDMDDQPLTKLASKIPKKESVDLLDLLDSSQITVKRKSNLKLKAPPKKIAKKKEVVAKPSASKPAATKPAEKKKGVKGPSTQFQEDFFTENHPNFQIALAKRTKRRRGVMILLQCSRVLLFKKKGIVFMCIYCDQKYLDPAKLREHNKEHEDINPVEMNKAIARLNEREQYKADITDVSCRLCETPIYGLDDLLTHLLEKHKKKIDKSDIDLLPFRISLGDFRCVVCDESFTHYKLLNHHMNVHYVRYVCDQCGSGFVNSKKLESHVLIHKTGSFPCKECNKVFNSKYNMNAHFALVHMKVKSRPCPQCPEKFSNVVQRMNHLVEIHGIKLEEFRCNLCPKVFAIKGRLIKHIRATHLKEKRFACVVCDAKFFGKSELTKHMSTHTGEKKHQCSVCQKSYSRNYHLQRHLKTHDV